MHRVFFIIFLLLFWFLAGHRIFEVTQAEINRANGITPAAVGFERPLLSKPSKEGNYFGSKISEEDPEAIMTGVTRTLLSEYEDNSYATYPLGYYKVITLSSSKQKQVLEILCEITGLTEEELKNLPDDYFPTVTGTMISFEAMNVDKDGNLNMEVEGGAETKAKIINISILYRRSPMNISKIDAGNGRYYWGKKLSIFSRNDDYLFWNFGNEL